VRSVVPEGRGGVRVQFDGEVVLKPSELKPERLPARTGADLYHAVLRQHDLLDARAGMSLTART
jgi:hypothetical protein